MTDTLSISLPTVDQVSRAPRLPGIDAGADLLGKQEAFTDVLSKARNGGGDSEAELARKTAQDFVAVAFVQPVLKQLRESGQAAPPFAPNRAEQQFRALMDAEIARKVVRASRWPLVDRLAQNLLVRHHGAAAVQPAGPAVPAADPGATPASTPVSKPKGTLEGTLHA